METPAKAQPQKLKSKGRKSGKDGQKKDRGQLFSQEEVNILLSLVDSHKNVIECKVTDGTTWVQKRDTWAQVTKDFNAAGLGNNRASSCLQNKWNSLKKTSRQEFAKAKRLISGTGGGEHVAFKSIVSATSLKVAEIVDSISIQGELDSPDSDSRRSVHKSCAQIYNEERSNKENFPENNVEVSLEERPQNHSERLDSSDGFFENLIENDEELENYVEDKISGLRPDSQGVSESTPSAKKVWDNYTPSLLRTPRHEALRTSSHGNSSLENQSPRRNNKRSYQQYNENLATKGNVMKLQEKYFKSLVLLQEQEEARKTSEIEWMKKKQKLEEDEYLMKTKKIEEFWNLKMSLEKEKYEREKIYDEHYQKLKLKSLQSAQDTFSKS